MSDDMSQPRKQVLDAIYAFIAEHRYPPSVRDLCNALGGASTSTVHAHLRRLQASGHIDWNPNQPRTIRLVATVVDA